MSTSTAEPNWLSTDEQRSWRAFLSGSRLITEALDFDLRPHGVSLAEYEILSMISESDHGGLRMSEIAKIVVQSRSRLTHTAARLERRGLVERSQSEHDRRGVILALTPAGRELLTDIARLHVVSVRERLVDVLTPRQFHALGGMMSTLGAAIEREGIEAQ